MGGGPEQIQQVIIDATPDPSLIADVGIWVGIVAGALSILAVVWRVWKYLKR